MKVIALIPARSGSKGIPDKNIRAFHGKPLIAHSIEQAKRCASISRVIVSTDSEAYAALSRQYGAETPFLRPPEISGDHSTDLEAFLHALTWLRSNEGYEPDLCVHLRPTHPNRTPEQIEQAIQLISSNPHWDSMRSVVEAPETPFKMWFMGPSGTLRSVTTCSISEAHSTPRQILPKAYLQNACIDIIRSSTILAKHSIAGTSIGAYLMKDLHDIDTPQQMAHASNAFSPFCAGVPGGKLFVFDIDGVIATLTPANDYSLAKPLEDNIQRINRLYDAGNRIVLFTARGFVTGKDWSAVTQQQMRSWQVKHHELRFGKPAADYYVDDKMLSLHDLQALDEIPIS